MSVSRYGGTPSRVNDSYSLSIESPKVMSSKDQLQLKPRTIQLGVLISKLNFASLPKLYTLSSLPAPSNDSASSALRRETVSKENRVPTLIKGFLITTAIYYSPAKTKSVNLIKSLNPSKYRPRNGRNIGSSSPRMRSRPKSIRPPSYLPLPKPSKNDSGNSVMAVNTAVLMSPMTVPQRLGKLPIIEPVGQYSRQSLLPKNYWMRFSALHTSRVSRESREY